MIRTIGFLLREARLSKKITLSELSLSTKIKSDFLESLEREDWNKLPEYPVVLGFVKRLAQILDVDENKLVLTLRRDYPPTPIAISPKKDLKTSFIWNPSYTFVILIGICILAGISYLVSQYIAFNAPPKLSIVAPIINEEINKRIYKVEGETSPDTSVKVNNQTAFVEDNGKFYTEIELTNETEEIEVNAISRSGKITSTKLPINVNLKE